MVLVGRTRRRAKIPITVPQVHGLLGLPDDVRVVSLRAVQDPDMLFVVVEGDSLPEQDVHGRDYGQMAYQGTVEAPYLWHPCAVNRLVWGDWVPGRGPDDAAVSMTPLSRSTIASRLAGVLSEYGSADTASDARLLRELSNAVERLVAEGAVAEPV